MTSRQPGVHTSVPMYKVLSKIAILVLLRVNGSKNPINMTSFMNGPLELGPRAGLLRFGLKSA